MVFGIVTLVNPLFSKACLPSVANEFGKVIEVKFEQPVKAFSSINNRPPGSTIFDIPELRKQRSDMDVIALGRLILSKLGVSSKAKRAIDVTDSGILTPIHPLLALYGYFYFCLFIAQYTL